MTSRILKKKPELIYGMAKFANPYYGYGSIPKNFKKKKFLNILKNKFKVFECADRYKGSTNYLTVLKNKKIHYKIDNIPIINNYDQILNFFKKKIIKIIKKLNGKEINVLYLHQNDFHILSNKKVLRALSFLKNKKYFKYIGVSVYSEKELKFALNCNIYKFIQIPLNLVDSSMYFKNFKNFKKKKIVARSIFLQGVIFNEQKNKNINSKIKNYRKKIFKICKKNNISIEELAINFVSSLKKIDYIIMGSISEKNIQNIKNIFLKKTLKREIMKKLIKLSSTKKKWANPKNWVTK